MVNAEKNPHFHGIEQTSYEVLQNGQEQYKEERDEEEYFYVHAQPLSEESVTINFLNDDRYNYGNVNTEHHEPIFKSKNTLHVPIKDYSYSNRTNKQLFNDEHIENQESINEFRERGYFSSDLGYIDTSEENNRMHSDSNIDTSPKNFFKSRALIDEASRNSGIPETNSQTINNNFANSRKIRQVGDTTIVTEHRDPYSFYWQLDQQRKAQTEPEKKTLHKEYVIDVEEEPEHYGHPDHVVFSPDSNDSGVNMNETLYSRPHKEESRLPSGWEKHEDPSGFSYYWHVDSGTIQRNRPTLTRKPVAETTISVGQQTYLPETEQKIINSEVIQQPVVEEHAFRQTTTKRRIENINDDSTESATNNNYVPKRFIVRSIGWVEIPEEELYSASKSSDAVNKAIHQLTSLDSSEAQTIQKLNNGKDLILEIGDSKLSLINPETNQLLNTERIQQIRVWGVGKENNRDFAYVIRDKNTKHFLCYVFRCDTPSRIIANTIKEVCKKLMAQRRPATLNPPTDGSYERRITRNYLIFFFEFLGECSLLTPIDEPKRVIRCHFIGVTQVSRATGIEVLNEAVDRLLRQIRPESWVLSDVSVAPSSILIVEASNGNQISRCRIRYLSFLGIGQDIKHCAFIMLTSSENFMCYVFYVEPSAAFLAKTIEAACKLRYQKVMDAHMYNNTKRDIEEHSPSRNANTSWTGLT